MAKYGKKAGTFTFWHENGQIASTGEYKNDLAEGSWTWWHENGQKSAIGKYTSFWVDNSGTGMSLSVGTVDASGKVLTFTKEDYNPATKKKVKVRDVIRIDSNDKHTAESYRTEEGGKEMKVMEIVYTRKK